MYLKPPSEQEELEEMYAFEARAELGGVSGAIYSEEKSERLVDYMLREDYSSFDETGQVW